ncbi:dTDP-4-dehydrorhamnose reductase [Grimontia marina]|uniref:dTDP-4-dehydrorhamnose reductase n=1 Tax=Grimontia marina TaxID=646534 RepID=A0A128ERV5_9GAMM|nr:dTDP-4-dehydrorhamnose reductase [Grimontia marina]CZF77317.1 dTDP-4-dehydrorhamnose reductase [Grimontia marina]
MILVTGANGLLANEIRKLSNGKNVIFVLKEELDITCKNDVMEFFESNNEFTSVINCAAGADAEFIEENPDWGYEITVSGPSNLAEASKLFNFKLIHISTDYVFDGQKNTPYTEEDLTNGLSKYGQLKAEGEKAILELSESCAIVRTAWLFSEQKRDFIGTMERIAANRSSVNVVIDQIGSPTYAPDLAKALLVIATELRVGEKEIFHFSNDGVCSWYDLACQIMKGLNLDCKVEPILSHEFPTKAKRPNYSVLSKTKVKDRFSIQIRHYGDALNECLENIKSKG